MEKSLIFMSAYLERFNVIHVHVAKQYYGGIIEQFYLKNMLTQELSSTRIVYDYEENDWHIYQLMVDNLYLGTPFTILNNHGLSCALETRGIVNDPMFDHLFAYDGDDLGPTYTLEETTFKVWSPTSHAVKLQYQLNGRMETIDMERQTQGIYKVVLKKDMEGARYIYWTCNGDQCLKTTDPYAYASTANGAESVVVNPKKFHKILKMSFPLKQKTDAVIYEVSVRDFTSSKSIKSKYRRQFLGVVEKGLTTKNNQIAGFDYLIDLGVTHVQLMPIFDFATIEETKPDLFYNWGYDPSQINVPEGSYCTDISDPYSRINECIDMVNRLHLSGLRVTMDMVVNHVYDVNSSSLERLVPYYYFRNDDFGHISNGSFCSNDINSECFMVRKYIVDMCKRWQKIYGMDGFRFDLMGILDIETINTIQRVLYNKDPNCLIYGEGWNMNTMLPDDRKAMLDNQAKMPNISFFNDQYRDVLKGSTFTNEHVRLGYLSGNTDLFDEAQAVISNQHKFIYPEQSINYVECHDNATMYDYLKETLDEDEETRLKRQKLLNTAVILSQGIPFLHCGQEFARSKMGVHNSFNSPDNINQVDWDRKDEMMDQVYYVKNLLKLRRKNNGFRYTTKEEIEKNVNICHLSNGVMIYTVYQTQGEFKQIKVIFNPKRESTYYNLSAKDEVIITTENAIKQEYSNLLIEPVSVYIIAQR
ncbi:type I pullulanase [Beduini massiliensis]|uniref:type I pullulanase n=1 Tax=Beduini massiliensis TaxID=1585974 RepID=UPI00059AA58B|nr:type I pullulanase [Beduini massiliensis]